MWITLVVLYPNYSKFHVCVAGIKGKITSMWEACGDTKNPCNGDPKLELLNPFYDNISDSQSTLLRSKQSFYFQSILWFNLLTFGLCISTFFALFSMIYNRHDVFWKRFIDIGGLVCQFYSWHSGADPKGGVQHKQNKDYRIDLVRKSKTYVESLKVIDKWYTHTVKTSLHPYGTWFALHWLLYTLTAFLSIAYVIEVVIKELYGPDPDDIRCHGEHNIKCRLTLAYTILFSLNHVFSSCTLASELQA